MLLFFNISGGELIFILLIALLLFGAKGFPNVARQLGRGIQEIKQASGEVQKDIRESADQVKEEIESVDPDRKKGESRRGAGEKKDSRE